MAQVVVRLEDLVLVDVAEVEDRVVERVGGDDPDGLGAVHRLPVSAVRVFA